MLGTRNGLFPGQVIFVSRGVLCCWCIGADATVPTEANAHMSPATPIDFDRPDDDLYRDADPTPNVKIW
jgi:hypothetical protein